MPESISVITTGPVEAYAPGTVEERVRSAGAGLTALLGEAEVARRLRAEVAGGEETGAVCAWNHFENIPTFYNWNNRPR
ncbi:multiple cyclophane-containing RiPP AmcA [Micromonosporaceae bacterium DT55]|uniref:multiple cyclophane-containing RiPP AmcA n=1 Tax=Melissospora conviva TaxID=3388432 RepID=UPI003C163758